MIRDNRRKPLADIPERVDLHSRNNTVIAFYKSGYSLRDVARAVGLNHERVRQILLQRGETIRPSHVHDRAKESST